MEQLVHGQTLLGFVLCTVVSQDSLGVCAAYLKHLPDDFLAFR